MQSDRTGDVYITTLAMLLVPDAGATLDKRQQKDTYSVEVGCMETIEVGGRLFEDADSLKGRIRIREMALQRAMAGGMPKPIYIGRKRWFDRDKVDNWLLTRRK